MVFGFRCRFSVGHLEFPLYQRQHPVLSLTQPRRWKRGVREWRPFANRARGGSAARLHRADVQPHKSAARSPLRRARFERLRPRRKPPPLWRCVRLRSVWSEVSKTLIAGWIVSRSMADPLVEVPPHTLRMAGKSSRSRAILWRCSPCAEHHVIRPLLSCWGRHIRRQRIHKMRFRGRDGLRASKT